MGIYHVEDGFVERLKGYDPYLRVRWGDQGQEWRIERKITSQKDLNPASFASHDDWITAKDGYCLILKVPHGALDERVFYTLWAGDMWKHGGAKHIADTLDDAYGERLNKSRAAWLDQIDHAARESYTYANTVRTVPESHLHTAPVGGMSIAGGV